MIMWKSGAIRISLKTILIFRILEREIAYKNYLVKRTGIVLIIRIDFGKTTNK